MPNETTRIPLETLIEQARQASERAYCPYSEFPVGAAVLAKSGKVYTGCNVENAAYGSTICAERNAILQMAAAGERDIQAVIIYTPTEKVSAPCGACRQVINEFGPEARIVSVCDTNDRLDAPLSELLPHAFGPKNLQ
ncbi:MAG TPA: cytidine deaminase [Verrucomicrobiae bacterium]|nr:cytidine deaminase [Verrucomicrobiae bacterium]